MIKTSQVNLRDIATLSQWAPVRERLELSGIFMAAMGLAESVLSHRGVRVEGGLLHAVVSAAACTALWGSVPTGILVFIRWLAVFTLWSLAANAFAIHMSALVEPFQPLPPIFEEGVP
jgi:hypothetical protein